MPGRGTGTSWDLHSGLDTPLYLCWDVLYVYYGLMNKVLFLGLFYLIKTKVAKDAPYFVLSPFKIFSAFHSLWKGKSVSLSNLKNKDLAAMLLGNLGIQINSKLLFWPEFTANLLLLSKRLLLLPGAAIIPCVSSVFQKRMHSPWSPRKMF